MNHPSTLKIASFAAAALLAACQQTPVSPDTGSGSLTTSSGSLPLPSLVLDENVKPSIAETNLTLSSAANAEQVGDFLGVNLTPAEQSYLNKNKFLLIPFEKTAIAPKPSFYNFDAMLTAFDSIMGKPMPHERLPENVKFVTPDIVLHGYHRYFELSLEELEKKDLRVALEGFLKDMVEGSVGLAKSTDASTKERGEWIAAQMITAQILLENAQGKPDFFSTPEDEAKWMENEAGVDSYENAEKMVSAKASMLSVAMQQRIKDELALIYAGETVAKSPLFNQYNTEIFADYTQYTPRSHYTKSSLLRAYFRTMMYLGRSSYLLKEDIGLKDATLVTSLLRKTSSSGTTPLQRWNTIMDITGFYAGQSDDVTLKEWDEYVKQALGTAETPQNLTPANVAALGSNVGDVRLPQILSDVIISENVLTQTKEDLLRETLGVRVFGQRFTFDAWVLNKLTAGDEMTETKLPSTPSALFVNAALGGKRAETHIPEFLKSTAGFTDADMPGFMKELDALRNSLENVREPDWFSSLGTAWTHVLASLTQTFGAGYPLYMQSEAFSDKQIQTFLGSYTELKHDTLLYAKQSYAELGGGPGDPPTPPPVPKGFVEPNLRFWNRLLQLVAKQNDLFTRFDLLKDTNARMRLSQFNDDVMLFGSIAEKELAGTPVTEEEYEDLRTTNLAYLAEPFDGSQQADEDSAKTELIADIHTDAKEGQILYQATGRPYVMLALVGNENSPRLVIGLAYNHYELTAPLGKRLTDEDWKKWVYDEPGNLPPKNVWYDSLVAN